MATRPKLTPVQVLERLQHRLEKRMEALHRVKLDGFQMVISELETEMDYLRRAARYLVACAYAALRRRENQPFILLPSCPSPNSTPSRPASGPPATSNPAPSPTRREAEDGCGRPHAPVQCPCAAIQGPGQRVGRELSIDVRFLEKLADEVKRDLG